MIYYSIPLVAYCGNRTLYLDHLSKEKRSWNMSKIRSKNTKPELLVRSALHKMGYRFRLNGKVGRNFAEKGVLPGKPDIVLAKYKTVIFIHGCFWHCHEHCKDFRVPKTNTNWWNEKLLANKSRDLQVIKELNDLGWIVVILWECEIRVNSKELYILITDRLQEILKIE